MTTTNRDIPLLLREKLSEDFDPDTILGYHYSIGYNTDDNDVPLDSYYYEQEENRVDGPHKVRGRDWKGRDNYDFCEHIYWASIPNDPFVAKNRGYYDNYHKRYHGSLSMICWAYIDVPLLNGSKEYKVSQNNKVAPGTKKGNEK